MGIRINGKTSMPQGMKLASKIATYLFEQECGELSRMSKADIEVLRSAVRVLTRK